MDYLLQNYWWLLLGLHYSLAFFTVSFEIMHNRDPVKSVSLIMAVIVLPVIGLFIYYFFAQEYRKDKIFNRKRVYDDDKIKAWDAKLIPQEEDLESLEKDLIEEKIKLVKLLQFNQKKPVTFKNEAKILINGEKKFDSLFKDLKQAKKHIHLEYYIYNSEDKIGAQLTDILCEKSREGIKVRISYDGVASNMSVKTLKKMRQCGIDIYPFMPVWFPNLTRKLNYRNHRKIVIIDGEIGYIGGVNISDEYVNFEEQDKDKMYWRDTHLRLYGHAVKSIQAQFLLNFNFISDRELKITDEFFPKIETDTKCAVQIASSGPDTDWQNIMEAIFTAINNAEHYIYITTPYFIPNNQILLALCTASRMGIEVRMLIPQRGDSVIARHATNSFIQKLLESGVHVYHYCKGMIHAKTLVIDGTLSTIGSCNLDNRSFDINFEINAFLYNRDVASQMRTIFEEDIKECEELSLEEWNARAYSEKVKEALCRLWAPLL